eukprot:4539927-Pyramimonas_sp.AAC.1
MDALRTSRRPRRSQRERRARHAKPSEGHRRRLQGQPTAPETGEIRGRQRVQPTAPEARTHPPSH